jgi:hypothetical protein
LIVMGEPGGSFLSRLFFGPGARLRAAVPAGAIVVRSAPLRVFHAMTDPVFVGPLHQAEDTLRLHRHPLLAVVENGLLVGVVRRSRLESAPPRTPVGELMEEAHPLAMQAPLGEKRVGGAGPGPWPVVDAGGRLVGTLHPPS